MEGVFWHVEEQRGAKNLRYLTKEKLNSPKTTGFKKAIGTKRPFSLPADSHLKGKLLFQEIFQSGLSLRLAPFVIRFSLINSPQASSQKVGFAVSKRRIKKASDRNKIKRLMREAARLNQHELVHPYQADKTLAFLILFTGKECPKFEEVNRKIKLLLSRLNVAYEVVK